MKKTLLLLSILFVLNSCTVVIDDYGRCNCTEKRYQVTEYNGQIIQSYQIGYLQSYNSCNRSGNTYIENVRYNGNYKYYISTQIYCY
jgi:hypothetical protein